MAAISLVVPAHNEAAYLPALLASVEAARTAHHGGRDAIEVIVADNASTDATAAIASDAGCRVVPVAERSIAHTRNAGARIARAPTLAFVDADSIVHPQVFNAIDEGLTEPFVAAATGVRMSRGSVGIAASMAVTRVILLLAGLDSGVVCCRRCDWETVGGFDESLRYAEDVRFLEDLKRLGRQRGQRFNRLAGVATVTSARKFDRYGDWHLFSTLARAGWFAINRRAWRRFTDRYWYGPR